MIQTPRVLHGCVFIAQVRRFAGEVLAAIVLERRRFSDARGPWRNQEAIGFRSPSKPAES
jgi:hypothetical protein